MFAKIKGKRFEKIVVILCLQLFLSGSYAQTAGSYRQQAEYEPTEAVWMLYPQITHKRGYSNQQVQVQMIKALAVSNTIKMVVPDLHTAIDAKKIIPAKLLAEGKVRILIFPYTEFWARDMGPVFVTNSKGEKAMADFMFNTWGYSDTTDEYSRLNGQLDKKIAAHYNLPLRSTSIISEGGNRELNSKGVLLLCEAVERQRNPSLTIEQLEPEYKKLLGVSKIIWLKKGLRDDDLSMLPPMNGPRNKKYYTMLTTGGHVDEFARFVNDSTILLGWLPRSERSNDIEKQTGERMEVNYEILQKATGPDGKPFHIIKMPMPHMITTTLSPGDSVYAILRDLQKGAGNSFRDGKPIDCVVPASYLNFIIANNVVLLAKYWHKGLPGKIRLRDEEARNILQKALPGKKIIAIDAMAVNYGGGGLHCITMNEPFGILPGQTAAVTKS